MPAAILLLAALLFVRPFGAGQQRFVPAYSTSTILNAAGQSPGPLAPNAIVSLYGTDLAYVTRAITPADIRGSALPTILNGTGVRILIGGQPAFPLFVSPRQVNFVLPASLRPGTFKLQLVLEGRAGPEVPIQLASAAPALFLQSEGTAIAVRADGSLVAPGSPAATGDLVILYATGLGETIPATRPGELATAPAVLKFPCDVRIDGNLIDPARVLYAGLAPGFAGLYQVNLRLPMDVGRDPEIRLAVDGSLSPEGIRLPVR